MSNKSHVDLDVGNNALVVDTTTLVVNASGYEDNVGIGVIDPDAKLEVNGDIHLTTDADKLLFGAASDASIQYDGSDMVFTQEVGTGDFVFTGGNVGIGTATPSSTLTVHDGLISITSSSGAQNTVSMRNKGGYDLDFRSPRNIKFSAGGYDDAFVLENNGTTVNNLVRRDFNFDLFLQGKLADEATGTFKIYGQNAWVSATTNKDGGNIYVYGGTAAAGGGEGDTILGHDGTDAIGNVGIGVTDPDAKLEVVGDIHLSVDDDALLFGTANDASIYYDGTDLIIDPAEVGSGVLKVGGSIYPDTDDTYYLGKNDDDTPFAWKGVILKDTTDGKYYRYESVNGVLTAVDLTD